MHIHWTTTCTIVPVSYIHVVHVCTCTYIQVWCTCVSAPTILVQIYQKQSNNIPKQNWFLILHKAKEVHVKSEPEADFNWNLLFKKNFLRTFKIKKRKNLHFLCTWRLHITRRKYIYTPRWPKGRGKRFQSGGFKSQPGFERLKKTMQFCKQFL